MKKVLAIVLVLAMAFVLVACGGTQPETKDPIKLTVWVGDNYPAATEQMIESFKAAYPDETFEITVGIESEGTCKDTVLNDPEAAADVYTFADDQLQALVDAGAIQPVTLNTEAIIAANNAGAVSAATIDGTLYAYPMSASNGYFLFYDSNFFTAEDVQSLNTMAEKAAADGKYVGMQFGTDGGWYIYSFFAGAGLNMGINEDAKTNSCDWNNATGEAVAQGILDLVATGGFMANTTANLTAAAGDGTCVALVNGAWDAAAIEAAYGDGYACAKLPTFDVNGTATQMNSFAGYKLIGVNPHSANVGWAMTLAEWLTNEENQTLRFETNNDAPSNINAAASEEVAANPAIAALSAQSEFAVVQRVGGNYWSPAATLGTILSNGNPDNIPLSELLNTAVEGIVAPVADE